MTSPGSISWPREALQAAYILMETAWLAAVLLLLDALARPNPGPLLLWIGLIYAPAYAVGRWGRARGWRARRRIFWGAMSAAALLAVGLWILWPELRTGLEAGSIIPHTDGRGWVRFGTILAGGAYIWLRGWWLADRQTDVKAFSTGFQVGMIVLLSVLLLGTQIELPAFVVAAVIASFFLAGLSGLCLARLIDLAARRVGADAYHWMIVLPATVVFVILAGAAVWLFLDREILQIMFKPFLWLWEMFVRLMVFLSRHTQPDPPLDMPFFKNFESLLNEVPYREPWDLSLAKTVARWVYLIGTVLLVMAALFRFLHDFVRWLRRRWGDASLAAVENLDTGFWDDLKALIAAVGRWAAMVWKRLAAAFLHNGPGETDGQVVRRIYRRLLRLGAAKGRPRPSFLTPHEYMNDLETLFGEKAIYAREMTEQYVRARYGPPGTGPESVRAMKIHWRRLKSRRRRKRK